MLDADRICYATDDDGKYSMNARVVVHLDPLIVSDELDNKIEFTEVYAVNKYGSRSFQECVTLEDFYSFLEKKRTSSIERRQDAMRSKATLNKRIESKSKEMTDLAKEIEDLKHELSILEKLDIQDKLSKRLIKFEEKIKTLIEHIEDFNSKRLRMIFELLIEEDYLSIVDIESNKKVSTIRISGANDLAVERWIEEQSESLRFYRDVVSDYREYLVNTESSKLTLKFNEKLTFFLSNEFNDDVEINVQRRLTSDDVIDELISRYRTRYEDRKYESDFWKTNDEKFILIEEATFDRPAVTIDREIEDILELFT